ncbi:type I DNA topoisomerase [Agrococcus sp. HG114]|uniref:type I DNA topoisomerase n=1 Tax=Agrococcus sp. HG114 TaxID=2969757 RepID=UPI00215A5FC2|nr:type I DNA topoisomerase [Agrococcus sp. HG114]MCR8669900.1 type I DNA topoisomerase [Agrococcus sp. HG114]
MSMGKKLVIVESPAKGKTIERYLGEGYQVLASVGHVRDLVSPRDLPADLKKGAYGKFAVDVDHGFAPYYVVSDEKKKTVAELKRALKDADELILATDEDREGEAIAWHLLEVLKPKVPVKRMVFHEITKDAIEQAKDSMRELNMPLVDAQETRRILDRLYGYEVSPVLWRKVRQGLSAGRVQSPTARLIVDRERERMAFVPASYWSLTAQFEAEGARFGARLVRLGGARVATGSDFDDRGQIKGVRTVLDAAAAEALAAELEQGSFRVAGVESKPYRRRPSAPFTTSTLQQEAGRKLKLSAKQTMSVAQSLYEQGYITYMRTDSPSLSAQAIKAAREQAAALYGKESIPQAARHYSGKSKSAQEAHEAIRPSGDAFRTPSEVKGALTPNEHRLYELIWKRTVASQMIDATGQTATITIASEKTTRGVAEFTASGTVITEPGFLQAYEEGKDASRYAEDAESEGTLPDVKESDPVSLAELERKDHVTTPPPRYTEASLVKALEELEIGRPSTYASIIDTIVRRGFVTQRGGALVPNWIAFSTIKLLEDNLGDYVDYDFTAEMLADLDRIADGELDREEWLRRFYFGSDERPGLKSTVENLGDIDARAVNSIPVADGVTLRVGQYGPYLEGEGPDGETKRANIPEDLTPDQLTPEKAAELFAAEPAQDRVLGQHPETGLDVVVKDGRFGPYIEEALPVELDDEGKPVAPKKGKAAPKPRRASLFKTMEPESVDLDTALKLLALPRVVGVDPESGDEITARPGRYGPFLSKGTDTRSLDDEDQIFSITLEQALERFAQPKYGARKAASALKEFDADPVSGKPVKVRDGRFGPYVTDGETNATIPRGEDVEAITFERAVELLQLKREKGPAKKPARKPAAKKPAAKTAAAKSAGAKTTAGKTTGAKTTAARKPAAKKKTDTTEQP